MALPAYLPTSQRDKKVAGMALPVRFADVRLVTPLKDPKTGHKRDVIVKLLRGGSPYQEREYGSNLPRHTRYIAGEDIEIAWPDAEIPEQERHPVDTARYDVEAETYLPSIFQPPLPGEVMDELREKYGRMRMRHDDEWMKKKIIEDARSAWYEQRKMVVPGHVGKIVSKLEYGWVEEMEKEKPPKQKVRMTTTLASMVAREQKMVKQVA